MKQKQILIYAMCWAYEEWHRAEERGADPSDWREDVFELQKLLDEEREKEEKEL